MDNLLQQYRFISVTYSFLLSLSCSFDYSVFFLYWYAQVICSLRSALPPEVLHWCSDSWM